MNLLSLILWVAKSIAGLSRKLPSAIQHPILVVEDDHHDADMIEMYCESYGGKCVKVATLREAREKLALGKFRLMFVDEGMKDGSGVDFIDEITPKYPNLPVSIVTGDNEISSRLWSGRNWSIILKGTHGGALKGAIENAILTANGVNGHTQPLVVIITTWIICAASFAAGMFYRELPQIIELIKGKL